jgi:hypothetical protein
MTRAIVFTMMLAVALTVMATFAIAQQPVLITYQGFLTDSTGNPVPDGNYFLMFKLFGDSTGGTALWQESHYPVETSGGLFRVHLGSSYPLDPSTLGTEPLFLEILIQDQILSPRMRFTQVPEAVYARQLKGNIETEPGSFLFRSSLGDSAIVFNADGLVSAISVRSMEPPDHPAIEMRALADGVASLHLWASDGDPAISLASSGLTNAISVRGMDPSDDERIRIGSNIGGEAGFYMFNPEPGPPTGPVIAMNTGIGGQASLRMFNPQPEPPAADPLLEMMTGLNGVNFNIYSPLNGRTVGEAIEIATSDSGGSMQFYDENGTHVWLSIDPDGSEGDMTFYNSDGMPTVNISSLGFVGINTENPARELHITDVMRLQPRLDFPSSPGEGDICIVGGPAGNHIHCYLNGAWQQLD